MGLPHCAGDCEVNDSAIISVYYCGRCAYLLGKTVMRHTGSAGVFPLTGVAEGWTLFDIKVNYNTLPLSVSENLNVAAVFEFFWFCYEFCCNWELRAYFGEHSRMTCSCCW